MKKSHDKSIRKRVRELVAMAHERELNAALGKLHEQFKEWQDRKIDAFALSDLIHEFHQKTAREIWKMYVNAGAEEMLVSRALRLGLLSEAEVGGELVERLKPLSGFWADDDAADEKEA